MTETRTSHSISPQAQRLELSSLRARRITQGAGTLLVLLGLTVMTGWLLRLPSVLQVLPGQVAMEPFCL